MSAAIVIALDAMGGDNAPAAAVHGAVWAARDFGVTIQLVGQPEAIETEFVASDKCSFFRFN
ncbi:MAG: hypothetical protein P8X52_00385, partial [Limibacillus sp.]